MNEMLLDDEGNFVGYCYTHQGRKVLVEGEEGCQHEACVKLRLLPDATGPMFNITRLRQQNELGVTDHEMERDVIEAAERDGRSISRPR